MELSREQYLAQFQVNNSGKEVVTMQKEALERAWKNRDFEIELYWKRATYFWAFTAATFTGYFFVLRFAQDIANPYLELVLSIMGFAFSLSWYLVNKGSKKWQENWEKHIDMLEDEITGPIYKSVLIRKAPSVSGVNMKVSVFVTVIWAFLIFQYFTKAPMVYSINIDLNNTLLIVILVWFILSLFGFFKWISKLWSKKDDTFSFENRGDNYKNDPDECCNK